MAKKKFSYTEASEEIEKIIEEIESESVDVDMLAEKVKRAVYLIKLCKEKLQHTEHEIKNVLSGIETPSEDEDKELDDNNALF